MGIPLVNRFEVLSDDDGSEDAIAPEVVGMEVEQGKLLGGIPEIRKACEEVNFDDITNSSSPKQGVNYDNAASSVNLQGRDND